MDQSSTVCFVCVNLLLCSFFFQAEDGIRDTSVTGVQTCALPILKAWLAVSAVAPCEPGFPWLEGQCTKGQMRSEERRVGKGCRSRWWTCAINKKRGSVGQEHESMCTQTREWMNKH